MAEVAATRSAALALADERALMRQGYAFLDEKRVLIASEILRRLREYEALESALWRQLQAARKALRAAVQRHGLDGLLAYPPGGSAPVPRVRARTLFLGVAQIEAEAEVSEEGTPAIAVDPSPEAAACMAAVRALLALSVRVAAARGNLLRLANEYRRTERRARALENVLLPEIDHALATVQEHLDLADLEEVARTRLARRG